MIDGAFGTKSLTPHENVTEPLLSLRGITKRFGSLIANEGISLDLRAGEIVALLGENGAGKTTLMNVLFGHYVADAGDIRMLNKRTGVLAPLAPGKPRAALSAGIGMVHQHFTLAQNLTGFENIILGTEKLFRPRLERGLATRRLAHIQSGIGLEVDVNAPVSMLSIGEQQRIEILKALYRDARVLVLDEPTAVLTPQDAERLFEAMRALKARGLAIVFISHKMPEVLAISDRIIVLRAGRLIADQPIAGADAAKLAELMVGTKPPPVIRPAASVRGPARATLASVTASVSARDQLHNASLDVCAGEIVGIAGVSGNGQATLAALFSGMLVPASGRFTLVEQPAHRADPADFVGRGVGRIPEDRHDVGTIGSLTVADNLAIERLRDHYTRRLGRLDRVAMRRAAAEAITTYDVRCPGPNSALRLLSGGNIQKVILARALSGTPKLLLAHQPTRGLDVAATGAVHRRLLDAREKGAGILLISEDLDEVFQLADRIAVLYRGQLSEAVPVQSLSRALVGLMMAGEREPRSEAASA